MIRNWGYPDWYHPSPDQKAEAARKHRHETEEDRARELRLARGERSFDLGFNGGTRDD